MRLLFAISFLAIAACAPVEPPVSDVPGEVVADTYVAPTSSASRQAEQTLRAIASARYPGQNAQVIGNCGILIANVQEIEVLAAAGPGVPSSIAIADAVFARKEAQACMARNGITL